jgi:hypothetical protein
MKSTKVLSLIEKALADRTPASLEAALLALQSVGGLTDDTVHKMGRLRSLKDQIAGLMLQVKELRKAEKEALACLLDLQTKWDSCDDLVTLADKASSFLTEREALAPRVKSLLLGQGVEDASEPEVEAAMAFERKHGGVPGRFSILALSQIRDQAKKLGMASKGLSGPMAGVAAPTLAQEPVKEEKPKARKKAKVVDVENSMPFEATGQ